MPVPCSIVPLVLSAWSVDECRRVRSVCGEPTRTGRWRLRNLRRITVNASGRAAADPACSRSRRGTRRSLAPDRGMSEGALRMRCTRAVPCSFRRAERRSGRRPSACTRDCHRTERARRHAHQGVRDRHRSPARTLRAAKNSRLRRRDILEPVAIRTPRPHHTRWRPELRVALGPHSFPAKLGPNRGFRMAYSAAETSASYPRAHPEIREDS